MLDEKQMTVIRNLHAQKVPNSEIAKRLKISRNTVSKYIRSLTASPPPAKGDLSNPPAQSDQSIADIEKKVRTQIVGEKEGKALAEAYMEFKDELDEEMTKKLLALHWKYDDYLKKHNISFGDFVEDALEKRLYMKLPCPLSSISRNF